MNRIVIGLLVLSSSIASLVGCSSDESSTPSTTPAPAGSGSASSDSDKATPSSLGPKCTSFLDCCEQIAKSQPALAGSCTSTSDAIDRAIEQGASTSTYETSCGQALETMKQAGYCK